MDVTMELLDLKSHTWQYSYKTSALGPDKRPVDILHDFYIPALQRSTRYDRVAGYFRSSSLAAASQGFSAFTSRGGRMRLVVGADIDPADAEAILAGDRERFANALNRELASPRQWPEEVQNGVTLLAWMVAHGVLELRVAFRVHGRTRKALSFDNTEDGYVHEKWAIFADGIGNRLYVSGSLNESRTALVRNAENIDVHADWWGPIERERTEAADSGFEAVWNNHHPHLVVLTLPDAVQRQLVAIGTSQRMPREVDGHTPLPAHVAAPDPLERLRFALLRDGPKLPGGRYVGMETAPVTPWPHQAVVARRLIQTWPYSYLLCDEVGLGKTIEAGLAIRSLVLSGLAKRVLICPPASLTRQWHREMAAKFMLPFARALSGSTVRHETIFPYETERQSTSLYQPDLCIVSTGLLSRLERIEQLKAAQGFDIVLVDEAHYARRANPQNGNRTQPRYGRLYETIANHLRKQTRCLWLATATPMQLDWIEVFDLLVLTQRVGAFGDDPSITWAYYQALSRLVQGEDINPAHWQLLRRAIMAVQHQDVFLWQYLKQAVIDGPLTVAARMWLEHDNPPRGIDRQRIQRLIFSASPLSRVMLRHTRPLLEIYREQGQLGANLAQRDVLPVPRIVLEGLEQRADEALAAYCRDLTAKIAHHAKGSVWRTSVGFYLSFLRLRLASSLFAIRETLKRRRDKVAATLAHLSGQEDAASSGPPEPVEIELDDEPDDAVLDDLLKGRTPEDLIWEQARLDEILALLGDLSAMPLKMRELLRVLNQRRQPGHRVQQTVVFTRFYDTLQDLVTRLRQIDSRLLIGTYSGQGGQYIDPQTHAWKGTERDEIKHRFLRGEIDILICTDAAAEGLNLQTADLLINYDLPWNPMKVEQRIGRIDRIGQKHARIKVLNLCYANSAEQIVYERLLQRLVQAGYVVGMQQISMLPVTREEFNALAARELTAEELEGRARERIVIQKQRTASMEISAHDLFDTYMRMQGGQDHAPPVTLAAIWQAISESQYLRDLGCIVSSDPQRKLMTLAGLPHLSENTAITVDRDLYESGFGAGQAALRFATYGEPVFEALLNTFALHDLPSCVVRLTETVPDLEVEVVAYAVACIAPTGLKSVRLITSWQQLKGLTLDNSAPLGESELLALRAQFHDMVWAEFQPTLAVPRIERHNQTAALAQSIFNLVVADRLLPPFDRDVNDPFRHAISHWDHILEQRENLVIGTIKTNVLTTIAPNLLIEVQIPRAGDEVIPVLPIFQVAAALDAACRIADGFRVRRADVTVDRVKRGVTRELSNRLKRYHQLATG